MTFILFIWQAVEFFSSAGLGSVQFARLEPFIDGNQDIILYLIHVLLAWDPKSASAVGSNQHCLQSCPWFFHVLNCTGMLILVEYPQAVTALHRFVSDFTGNMYLLLLFLAGKLRASGRSLRQFPVPISTQVIACRWIMHRLSQRSSCPWYPSNTYHYTIYISPSLSSVIYVCSYVSRLIMQVYRNFQGYFTQVQVTMIPYY